MIRAAALIVLFGLALRSASFGREGGLLQENCDEKEAKTVLGQFNRSYGMGRDDEGKREGAISLIRQKMHGILLDRLIEVGKAERSVKVRAAVAEALGEYRKSEKAAETLALWLRKDQLKEENYLLAQRCLQALGSLAPEVGRKQIEKVNDWFDFRDGGSAKAAVMAAGALRDKSSIEPLIAEMQRCQRDMLKFIVGEKIDGCDGG